MATLFPPSRALLLPQFETYRLTPLDPDTGVVSSPLPSGQRATQSRMSYTEQKLSFKEVRARIAWDHLAVGEGARAVYIDEGYAVVGVQLGPECTPQYTTLATLPTPIASTSSAAAEYPSARQLDSTHWAVSSGSGSLYILRTSPAELGEFTGTLTARYDLSFPFLIRSSHTHSPNDSRLLLSRSAEKRKRSDQFEILELRVDLERTNDLDAGEEAEPRWVKRGGDAPVFCGWWNEGWLVLASEEMRSLPSSAEDQEEQDEIEAKERERKDRIAKLGLGASVPTDLMEVDEKPTEPGLQKERDDVKLNEVTQDGKQWPFSWTQTPDSLSIVVPLPAGSTRSDLTVSLTTATLSLALSPTALSAGSPILATFLSRPVRVFWATVDPSTSTYAFNLQKCELEIELTKVDENNRWPSVFLPSSPGEEDEEDEEEEVPETISAEQMAAIRNTFSQVRTRQADEPEGNHPAIPALLREEMEYDLEDGEDFGEQPEGAFGDAAGGGGSRVGRDVLIGWVRSEDEKERWSKGMTCVLSLPMSGKVEDGLIVKNGVDGLRFVPPPDGGDVTRQPWRHVSTNPALGFVLSSKRDLRLVRHVSAATAAEDRAGEPPSKKPRVAGGTGDDAGSTVLAFDSGSSETLSGNVYVYYPSSSTTIAKQGVVRVSGVERGALLGVGVVRAEGKDVVLGLCEKEAVVLREIL